MKHEIEYTRLGKHIRNVATGETQEFKSISAAKRWSREWQAKSGGLGIGKLRVV